MAAHSAVRSRREGMDTRSSVVWIFSAMAERASTAGTPKVDRYAASVAAGSAAYSGTQPSSSAPAAARR